MARRALLIAINYWPELTGIGKYMGEMAEWLVDQGVDVRVVTAPPYYPAWRVDSRYSAWRYRSETRGGVRILRCPLWVPRRPSGLTRIVHLASFAVSALPILLWWGLRWRPTDVFVVEPPLFCAPGALGAARLAGGRAWLHVQDFEVDAAFDLGILKSKRLRGWVLRAERWLMGRFDLVSTISNRMLGRLGEKGVDIDRQMLFPNWVDLETIHPETGSPLRAEWGIAETDTVILYSGNLGEKQGLEVLVAAAMELRDRPRLRVVICGDGAARQRLERMATAIPSVVFKPLQPVERLNDLLNLADIHVLPQRADAADLVLPSKLTNMLASGRPVVATANPGTEVAELVRGCGMVIPPDDPAALAAALGTLADAPDHRRALGKLARALAENLWDKERVLRQAFDVDGPRLCRQGAAQSEK